MEEETKPQEKNELEECRQTCEEYLNNWKRERADFLNYKKEEVERISLLAKYTKEEMILKMLPILDSIYWAERQVPDELKNHNWIEGFLQTKKQIDAFLEREQVERIEVVDKPFNPTCMEAVEEIEDKGKQPNMVVEEVQRGYMIDGKVLRPARVKITK